MVAVFGRRLVSSEDIRSVLEDGEIVVYHGSNVAVRSPDTTVGRRKTDFGQGFYVTNDMSSALDIASQTFRRRKEGRPIVTSYLFDYRSALVNLESQLQVYWGPTDEWAEFIINNRTLRPTLAPDLVIGPIADHNIVMVINEFLQGRRPYDETVDILKNELFGTEDTMQIAFRSPASLAFLHYLGEQ